jgi:hypothetical protein
VPLHPETRRSPTFARATSWLLTDYADPKRQVPLSSIDCALPLAEIDDKVDLPAGYRENRA